MLFLLRIKFCIAADKLFLNVAKLLFCSNKKRTIDFKSYSGSDLLKSFQIEELYEENIARQLHVLMSLVHSNCSQ